MEFGLFNALYLPHEQASDPVMEHRRLLDEVTSIQAADRSGFKYTWASEHHFLTEYSHLSANESFLAFVAAKTERIHVGTGIFNITPPVNHPSRVASGARIDHLSEGVESHGRGSSTTEQGASDHRPGPHKEMFDAVCPSSPACGGQPYSHAAASSPARAQRPAQARTKPPRRWGGRRQPGTFEKAAHCLGVPRHLGSPSQLARSSRLQKNSRRRAVGATSTTTYVTTRAGLEDGKRASGRDMASSYHQSLVFRYLDTFPKPPFIPTWPEVLPEPTLEEMDARIAKGLVAVGTPDECIRNVQRYADIGADQLTFGMLSSTMPIETCVEAVETFGRHVLPQFDTAPVHRTTRQREAALAVSAV